jgi:membrane associated rhomboid family serine protease
MGGRPYVSYVLVIANVLVWLAGLVLGGSQAIAGVSPLAVIGGLSGPRVAAGEWWRIFSAGFLHSGLIHLGFNMAALLVLGPLVERALGRTRFATLYLTALVASSLGALLASPNALTVGASGAIFGLMGATIVGQRAGRMDPRASGIVTWLLVNLAFTFIIPGISIGGHLGGLAGGLVAGVLLFGWRGRRLPGLAGVGACLVVAGACFVAALWVAARPMLG